MRPVARFQVSAAMVRRIEPILRRIPVDGSELPTAWVVAATFAALEHRSPMDAEPAELESFIRARWDA